MTKPYVVGIAGGTASGKTTFTEKLAGQLAHRKLKVYHIDEYFKPREERPQAVAHVTGITYTDDNHPETINLPLLRQDLARDIAENQYEVILVEGHFALHDDAIVAMLDLKLFIECRADERIVRRLKRNMQWGLSFDEVSSVYLDMVRYRHDQYVEPSKWRADLFLNGSNFSEKALDMVVNTILAALA